MPGVPDLRRRPWVMRMRWVDLLFAHWAVDADALRTKLPDGLELDLYDGQAWLGIVPFVMEDVGPRGLPAPPAAGRFPELNVRTYVRHEGRPGVWFLSLDAASRPAVEGARTGFGLPYFHATMSAGHVREDKNLRGRAPGETAGNVLEGVRAARTDGSARATRSDKILEEMAAVRAALRRAIPGDLVVCCVDDAIAVYREATAAAGTSRGGTAFADPGELEAPEG